MLAVYEITRPFLITVGEDWTAGLKLNSYAYCQLPS